MLSVPDGQSNRWDAVLKMAPVKLILPSKIEKIEEAAYFVEKIAKKMNFPSSEIDNIAIATTEAVSNAIVHGNHEDASKNVLIEVYPEEDRITIIVEDEGEGFDPENVANPLEPDNLLRERGRGIFILKSLMDEVEYSFPNRGTRVTMTKFKQKTKTSPETKNL